MLNAFYSIIIYPILYILPAEVANSAPLIFGGGPPLDLGRKLHGRRIFGDHKTIRGTIAGIVAGIVMGLIEYPFIPYMLAISVFMAVGAMFGDVLGSFVKRRIGLRPGKDMPWLDQYGFFVFAILFAAWLGHLPDIYGLIFIAIGNGLFHVTANRVAYILRLKMVPW
ncbi:MAG: CDP-2,3-bis-(O-geranylgeranyl)-sn-glycerol synthase [Candidatus Marsarchaeota archaeon]|jgi:CDP-2,3-bis-(O-geranylgeranyl)-sn-glycerol synthase|nr:CDP-2,3-bis-(O-geranylgeranyl)-sn-glycerol synthase [Candidatus Marsarchaeota archaeon]MCL5115089.1 CDP-2,3-bis-(O-geranylgeranyl)-sn-glycerol synthase [Candidatus Marsarchaeota archaeon]